MGAADPKARKNRREPARAEAAAELRQRAGKNLVFGIVAAAVGGVLAQWSDDGMGNTGLSVTQIIYWCLVGGGALEAAIGAFQYYQAREIAEGRMKIPEWALREDAGADTSGPVEVTLEPARGRHVGWGLFSGLLGLLLLVAFGGLGVLFGIGLLLWSAYHLARLVQIVTRKPQTIRIRDDLIHLPEGAFGPTTREVKPKEIGQAYFLRRQAPRFHTLPVLVVEVGDEAILYPRDWFASERDQERVAAALWRRIDT